jgi:hypothetical protein
MAATATSLFAARAEASPPGCVPVGIDSDHDGVDDACDNCPRVANNQADADADGVGDLCEPLPVCGGQNTGNGVNPNVTLPEETIAMGWRPDSSFMLSGLSVFTGGTTTVNRLVLWADDEGTPADFSLSSNIFFANTLPNGWKGGDFAQPVQVIAGRRYYILWMTTGGEQGSVAPSGFSYRTFTSTFGAPDGVIGYPWDGPSNTTPWMFQLHCDAAACASDVDGDGVCDGNDNCPSSYNDTQEDTDGDGIGDWCDSCPYTPNLDQTDSDGDGYGDVCDNCPSVYNIPVGLIEFGAQPDADGDGIGDACEAISVCGGDNRVDAAYDNSLAMTDASVAIAWTATDSNLLYGLQIFTGESAGTEILSLWMDDGNKPAQPVFGFFSSDEVIFDNDAADGWKGARFPYAIPVTAGTKYWIVWTPSAGAQASVAPSGVHQAYWSTAGYPNVDSVWAGPFNDRAWKFRTLCEGGPCAGQPDTDADGLCDATDNCPSAFNPSQHDADGDGAGDACDPTCVDLLASADAWVVSNTPSVNNGNSHVLWTGTSLGATRLSLLRFNLAALPAGARFESGSLTLDQMSVSGSFARSVDVKTVAAAWNEMGVTWNNKPAQGAALGSALNKGLANGLFTIPLTGQRPMSDLANGLYLSQVTDATRLWGKDPLLPGNAPKLNLCYTVPE